LDADLNLSLGPEFTGWQDMNELSAAVGQYFPDQKASVAIVGLAAATHDRQPPSSSPVKYALDSLNEGRLRGHQAVEGVTIGVEVGFVQWSSTELFSHEYVADARCSEGWVELLPVEMRSKSRVRVGANVDDKLDFTLPQQPDEVLLAVIGVADSPNLGRKCHELRLSASPDG